MKTYKYDSFGNITDETGPSFNRGFTYTGRELHNRSDLYYYRARFYNPELGRFISQDPIGYLGGVNLYAYLGNSPIDFMDPLGFCGEKPSGWAALRTGIEIADILPIPHPFYQVPMEILSCAATIGDIYVAEVPWYRKAGAGVVAVYGLAGVLQAVPTPKTILIGTFVDATSFVASSYLLGNKYPGVSLVEYMKYSAKK